MNDSWNAYHRKVDNEDFRRRIADAKNELASAQARLTEMNTEITRQEDALSKATTAAVITELKVSSQILKADKENLKIFITTLTTDITNDEQQYAVRQEEQAFQTEIDNLWKEANVYYEGAINA